MRIMNFDGEMISLRDLAKMVVFSSLALFMFFGFCYLVFGHDWLPIGWDTPRYVWGMQMVVDNGVFVFIREHDYYNFVYYVLGGFLVFCGVSPFIVEIFLPISLCVLISFVCIFIFREFVEDSWMFFVSWLFLVSWFAVYRLGADLHANLLGLLLVLSASYFFLRLLEKSSLLSRFLMYFLMFLASFTHVEVTLFFTVIFVFTIVLMRWSSAIASWLRVFLECLGLVLIVAPASLLFLRHQMNLLSYGVVIRFPPTDVLTWIYQTGVTLPVSLLGAFYVLKSLVIEREKKSPYFVFVSSWVTVSVVIGLVQYGFPAFGSFSGRAITLFPMPFATGLGFKELLSKKGLSWSDWWRKIRILAIVSFIITMVAAPFFSRVYISHDAYRRVSWFSSSFDSQYLPIFVYYDIDLYSGSLGELYDNWVRAIFGEHFAYLGRIDFLVSGFETPFSRDVSRAFSKRVLSELIGAGVWNSDELFKHPIVVIEDFYLPRPLPLYFLSMFDEVYDGVFLLNVVKVQRMREFYVPVWCSIFNSSVRGWYGREVNGSLTSRVLFYKDVNPLRDACFVVKIPIAKDGNYTVTIRYFDDFGLPVKLFIDGRLIGEIRYTNSSKFLEFTTDYIFLRRGIYSLEFCLEEASEGVHFLCLDYVRVSVVGNFTIFL